MRILLIDDSAAYREEFAMLLADAAVGYSVLDYASSAKEGARLIAAGQHDLYVVDYRLPGGDGLGLIRDARKAGVTKPIIVLTGYGSPMVDKAAEEAGATDYLPKGEFTPLMLDRAIRYAIRNADAIRAAQEASNLFRLAQDAAGIGAWDWDIRGNNFTWSDRQRVIWGVETGSSAEPIRYQTWLDRIHPDDRDRVQAAMTASVGAHRMLELRFRIMRPNPARPDALPVLRWILSKADLVRDATAAPIRMVGINVDITEQQQAIAALEFSRDAVTTDLQASEARFQTYFESSGDCMFHVRIDPDGWFRFITVNPVGQAFGGTSLTALRNRTPREVFGADAGAQMEEAFHKVIETGLPYRYEPTFHLPVGPVVFDALFMPLRDQTGAITGILGSARDVTERRRLEAALHQSQKMEALGQLAGGVAHDFNNLLTGILGCFELLGKQVTSERGRHFVEQGIRAVERSKALTARLLAFSRQQPLTTQPVDVNASLEEITEMLVRTLGPDVRIGKMLASDVWTANTDRNQIELAILNLGINARDAMPLGGSLTISTRNQTFTTACGDIAPGDYVAIMVTDTGSGMTQEVLARVLEPFFTTKETGKGTGLGLSMVAGVVKQLGGGIQITSEVGKGTSVTLFLPRAEAEAEAATLAGSVFSIAPARLLLVEDDPDTVSVFTAYASEANHTVLVANSAGEAVALLEAGSAVDALVIDKTLPGVPWSKLIERARVLRPGLPVMLLSGETTRTEIDGVAVLAKPFRQDAFDAALAALLREPEPSASVIQLRPDTARRTQSGAAGG